MPDILQDQKKIYWDFPRNLGREHNWIPTVATVAAIGALALVDQYESPYFRRTTTYRGFNQALSGTNTTLIIAGLPATAYLAGWINKNKYAQSTALLAGEAVADSEIAAELLKLATRRARPESLPPNGNFADTWTDSRSITAGGFPSGHTIAAFSIATVFSERYGPKHRWAPYVLYGVAGTIGMSRVTLSAHNVSDVFAGAALGYAIGRFVALTHHHR